MVSFRPRNKDVDDDSLAKAHQILAGKPTLFGNKFSAVTPMPPGRNRNGISSITDHFQDQPGQVVPPDSSAIGGGEDPGLDNSEMQDGVPGVQPQKKGLAGLFSGLFKNRTPEPGPDGMPQRDKPSIFKTIADVALPTLFSAVSGGGALPGLITGLASHNAGIEGKYNQDMDAYNDQQKLGVQKDYYKDLLKQRADESNNKWNMFNTLHPPGSISTSPKLNDRDRYFDIIDRFKNGDKNLSTAELDWAETYKNNLKFKKPDAPIP